MQRSSDSIGSLAAAFAKAQAEPGNPGKSLTASTTNPAGGQAVRTFRYGPVSSGLDIVCETLGPT